MRSIGAAALAALALAAAAPAAAQQAPSEPARMSQAEMDAVQLALDRGTLIYAYDQAAWHGTDDMLAKLRAAGLYDSLAPRIGGWVVDGTTAAPELVFFDKDPDPQAVYVARFGPLGRTIVAGRLLGEKDDRTLSPAHKALIAAQRAARAALEAGKPMRCTDRPFNTVVLPPASAGAPTLVYFLTPQVENASVPAGGHYRIEVSADGKAGEVQPFTKSCLSLPLGNGKDKSAAVMVTHLLGPVPTEVHVFTMYTASLPLFVTTGPNRTWAVEAPDGAARVRLLDPGK